MRTKGSSDASQLGPAQKVPGSARKERLRRSRERWRDPLLTVLTILLALLMFVIAPLHAEGIMRSQEIGLAVAPIVIVAVLFQSGISTAIFVMLIAFVLATTASLLRLQPQHSNLDLYLDASAWILIGLALSWVVARAVFAPGRIYLPSHYGRHLALFGYRSDVRGALHVRWLAGP